ncbi:hypothetical protein PoB_001745100 [Plakobranchus ocellatus]|uniref:Uncharacterized protein n=1 Tax=Plakobranchus ocellatus TaxID=259542 RepID=A0AAV3Z510_9GAST|nr:hypothetical protein PoB_001745100 [Plakobranchus ocellatus]
MSHSPFTVNYFEARHSFACACACHANNVRTADAGLKLSRFTEEFMDDARASEHAQGTGSLGSFNASVKRKEKSSKLGLEKRDLCPRIDSTIMSGGKTNV